MARESDGGRRTKKKKKEKNAAKVRIRQRKRRYYASRTIHVRYIFTTSPRRLFVILYFTRYEMAMFCKNGGNGQKSSKTETAVFARANFVRSRKIL